MAYNGFYDNPDLADGFGATAGRQRPHRGLDFPKRQGTPVPALYSGKVVRSEYHSGLGWVVEVQHDKNVFMGYCHLQKKGLPVGASVVAGTVLGYTGNTGAETTGPHTHVTKGNRAGAVFGASMDHLSNPWPYISDAIRWSDCGSNPAPKPAQWAFNRPSAAMQKRIQAALKKRGRYSGPVDGVWGANTIKGIQTSIKGVGYTGAVDGVPGERTCRFVQVYAQRFGDYKGPVDSILGPNGWAGFALGLERP